MLQSFIGTLDAAGLRSLRTEDDALPAPLSDSEFVPFWVILDSSELPSIERALVLGQRQTALQLLVAVAKSLGPVGI